MVYCAVFCSAILAGVVQTLTGFGSGVVMLMFFPYFFNMLQAPALATAIVIVFTYGIVWKFRKHLNLRLVVPVALIYLSTSVSSILIAKKLDLDLLSAAFGVFLILLSLYYLLPIKTIEFNPTPLNTVLCVAAAGLCGGLFGIGGPLMAVYFLSVTKTKESYLANLQGVFCMTNVVNTTTRVLSGIYTLDLIPFTLLGFVGITAGRLGGQKLLDRIDADRMRTIIYIFVGISGVLNVAEHLF